MGTKKNGIYRVYLANGYSDQKASGPNSGWDGGVRAQLALGIEGIVGTFARHPNSPFSAAKCFWDPSTGCLQDHEVVIRFLTQRHSVVAKLKSTGVLGPNGSTLTDPRGTVSEVYVETVNGDPQFVAKLARLAVHEMMHNKLESPSGQVQPVPRLHALAGARLGRALVEATTAPSPMEIALMARHLARKVKQYPADLTIDQCKP